MMRARYRPEKVSRNDLRLTLSFFRTMIPLVCDHFSRNVLAKLFLSGPIR
jgi:hypothetical protein